MNTISELKASPMLYLSGGSKELFHSNFLYWLGINYRDFFQRMMSRLCQINTFWPNDWVVRREYRHLDLSVTYKKETGKTRKGKPVMEECAFIILENKVKSLPDLIQLRRYEQVYDNHDSDCTYVVLSLSKEFHGRKYLIENTRWQLHYYEELAGLIEDCCSQESIRPEHLTYIHDYCQYIVSLSVLADKWKFEEDSPFLYHCEELRDLRLNDIFEKVRYAQIAALLAEKLKPVLIENSDEETIVLGMSNTDVILRRDGNDADEILHFYGCSEAKPFQQVFIGSGMSHAVGLVEAKIKIDDDCCLVVQVQGDHYCHAIERKGIFNHSVNCLSKLQKQFIDFKFGGLGGRDAKAVSKICHYNSDFIYKWQKILPSDTVGDIINAMITDVTEYKNKL